MARRVDQQERARWVRGGRWLFRAREHGGLSQGELADRLGVHQTQVSAYEWGRYGVGADVARRIAQALGLSELDVWLGLELPLPREVMPAENPASPQSREQIIAWYREHIRDLPPPPESPEEILAWYRETFPHGIRAGQTTYGDPNRRTGNTADNPGEDQDSGGVASDGA